MPSKKTKSEGQRPKQKNEIWTITGGVPGGFLKTIKTIRVPTLQNRKGALKILRRILAARALPDAAAVKMADKMAQIAGTDEANGLLSQIRIRHAIVKAAKELSVFLKSK